MDYVVWSDTLSQLETVAIISKSPLSWWLCVLLSLFLINTFQLGPHCFSWSYIRRKVMSLRNGTKGCSYDSTDHGDMNGTSPNHSTALKQGRGINKEDDDSDNHMVLCKFIQTKLIPKFVLQCRDKDDNFAVLVFSRISSLRDIKRVKFNQITFNGKAQVDCRLTTYPEDYRYENYVVARSDSVEHPESSIMKQIPTLLAAYGKRERCYMEDPKPKLVLLYSLEMPCANCTHQILKSLYKMCSSNGGRSRVVLAYSQLCDGEEEEGKRNHKRLVDAGFIVVKVRQS